MALRYAEPDAQVLSEEPFFIELRRDGEFIATQTLSETQQNPLSFRAFDRNARVPSGIPYTFEARTVNLHGETSAWSTPIQLRRPHCDGQAFDNKIHRSHAYILVSFADYARDLPFTLDTFRNDLLVGTTHSGERISTQDYFELISYGNIELQRSFYDWVILPGNASAYCPRFDPSQRDHYGCDFGRVGREALRMLKEEGQRINVDTPIFVINGMGSVGWSNSEGAYVSAYQLTRAKLEHPLPYQSITHEILHTAGLEHASLYQDCQQGVAPSRFNPRLEDADCRFFGYGLGVMGTSQRYQGLSAWQRFRLGYLDASRIQPASLTQAQRIEIFDLDLKDPQGPQMIGFDLTQERDVLPVGRRLFLEYSMPNQRLRTADPSRSVPGLRIGLRHAMDGQTPLRSLREHPRSEVQYLGDVQLRDVGDRASLPALGIELEVKQVKATSIVVDLVPQTRACQPGLFDPTYTLYRNLYARGRQAEIVEEVQAVNNDQDCPRRDLRWNTTLSQARGDVDLVHPLMSGQPYLRRKAWDDPELRNATAPIASSLQIQAGAQSYTRDAWLDTPEAFSVGYETGHTIIQGQPQRVTLTNHRDTPITLTLRPQAPRAVVQEYFRMPTQRVKLAPGQTRSLIAFQSKPETPIFGSLISFLAEGFDLAVDLNAKPHTRYNVKIRVQRGSCSDAVQNGQETGVDCGGVCPACPPSQPAPALPTWMLGLLGASLGWRHRTTLGSARSRWESSFGRSSHPGPRWT